MKGVKSSVKEISNCFRKLTRIMVDKMKNIIGIDKLKPENQNICSTDHATYKIIFLKTMYKQNERSSDQATNKYTIHYLKNIYIQETDTKNVKKIKRSVNCNQLSNTRKIKSSAKENVRNIDNTIKRIKMIEKSIRLIKNNKRKRECSAKENETTIDNTIQNKYKRIKLDENCKRINNKRKRISSTKVNDRKGINHTLKFICKRKKNDNITKRNTIEEPENITVSNYDECKSILKKERLCYKPIRKTSDTLLSLIYLQQINECIYNYLLNRLLIALTTNIVISAIKYQHILLCNVIYK